MEAESVAYVVCEHFGINTSDYSFGYVAGWSDGKETTELKASLTEIRGAASEMITAIDQAVEKELDAVIETGRDVALLVKDTAEKISPEGKAKDTEPKEQTEEPRKKPSVKKKLQTEKEAVAKKPATKAKTTKSEERA